VTFSMHVLAELTNH